LPAVADIQNTVVKEFIRDPRVVTGVLSKGESRETLENFWGNIYLRGQMIFDPTADIADGAYGQPATGLPASRAFVVGADGKIALPFFGHDPDRIIGTIYELLDVPDPLQLSLQESLDGTLLCWNDLAGEESYDVIRGRLDDLLRDGSVIDLGAVDCIETGSADNCTSGSEDPELPGVGEAFFYLVRHNGDAIPTYGSDVGARIRIPTTGDCPTE